MRRMMGLVAVAVVGLAAACAQMGSGRTASVFEVMPKIQQQIKDFFEQHGVKSVSMSDGNMGCPHEEGKDFPVGEDCPFCPFWAGKQGSNQWF